MVAYKFYILSRRHLDVYGVITENEKGVGVKTVQLRKGELWSSPFLHAILIPKSMMEKWDVEITNDEQDVKEFLEVCRKVRRLGIKKIWTSGNNGNNDSGG